MKESLINRLSQGELLELWALTQGEQNNHLKEELYQLTLDDNRRVAVNALWVFTHFALADNVWLFAKHDQHCLYESFFFKIISLLSPHKIAI